MVVSKSKKYTYAERVLGALSQVQKEHKRHAVHLATLRAQVKKTAQARKDVLGPKWSSWVGKAVHRLEDEGVLVALEPQGSVTLTPNGKKAIQSARRSLAIAPHSSTSPAEEDLIWKQVTQQLTGRGLKRKQPSRRRSSGVARPAGGDDESDEEEEVISTLKKHNTRSKRPRVSTTPKKSLSKMTKAELMAELKVLQQAEIDTAESRRLKQELKLRQEEIKAVRIELAEAKRVATREGSEPPHDGDVSSRLTSPEPMTPEPTTDIGEHPPSPTRSNLPIVPERPRPSLGMMRTLSRSLISELSKQPTPAPSSPDVENGFDVFGDAAAQGDAGPPGFDPLATPAGPPPAVTKEAELVKELERYKTLVSETRMHAEDREKMNQEKVDVLELSLNARSLELENLRKTLLQVQSERSENEQFLSQRMEYMNTEIANLRQVGSEKDSTISLKDARIVQLQAKQVSIDEIWVPKVAELERVVREHQTAIGVLTAEKDSYAAQVSSLRGSLHNLDVAINKHLAVLDTEALPDLPNSFEDSTQAEIAARIALFISRLEQTGDKVVEQSAAAAAKLVETRVRMTSILDELQRKAEAQLLGSNETLQESLSANDVLKERLSQSGKDVQDLRAQVISLERSVGSVTAQLETSNRTIERLNVDIAKEVKRTHGLTFDLGLKDQSIAELEESKAQSLTAISSLSTRLDDASESLRKLEKEREALHAELVKTRSERDQLQVDQAANEKERERLLSISEDLRARLSAEVTDRERDIVTLRNTIELNERNFAAAQTELKSTVSDRESTISAVKTRLESTQHEVDRLKSELLASSVEAGSRLSESRIESDRLQEDLTAEKRRAMILEQERDDVLERVKDAEDDIAELRKSKEADEATIESLKNGFTTLRKLQMQSLAELENGVVSAKSSPVRKSRRATKIV